MDDLDPTTLNGLAAKLDGLELTAAEQAILDGVFDRAAAYEPEVGGFSMIKYGGDRSGADLSRTAFQLGRGIGALDPGIGLGVKMDDWKPPPP